jgi:CheY-like chemotaxis protein
VQDCILVITPQASFGELIRQSLEETGHYRVEVAYQAADALARCRRPVNYRLVILDGDLPGGPLEGLIQGIRLALPDARIAAIPSENAHGRAGSQPLPVDGTLSKPFYLPSLAATVARLISGAEAAPAEPPADQSPSAAWPENPAERQAALTNLMAGAEALGALLLVDGEVCAAAGIASGEDCVDLVDAVRSRLDGASAPELLYYRKSPHGHRSIVVYAIRRGASTTLALIFPPEIGFVQARTRAAQAVPSVPAPTG